MKSIESIRAKFAQLNKDRDIAWRKSMDLTDEMESYKAWCNFMHLDSQILALIWVLEPESKKED